MAFSHHYFLINLCVFVVAIANVCFLAPKSEPKQAAAPEAKPVPVKKQEEEIMQCIMK